MQTENIVLHYTSVLHCSQLYASDFLVVIQEARARVSAMMLQTTFSMFTSSYMLLHAFFKETPHEKLHVLDSGV
jgi:hypothetical protein